MNVENTMAPLVSVALKINREVRQYTRIPINAEATLLIDDQVIEGKVVLLSLKGAYVMLDNPIEVSTSVIVTISDTLTSNVLSDMKATVVSATENGVGLRFE